MTTKTKDHPFDVIAASCEEQIRRGNFIFQKWTCDGCRQRVTSPNVNVLTHAGHCGHCNVVTDLVERGCNFVLLIMPGATAADVPAHVNAIDAQGMGSKH